MEETKQSDNMDGDMEYIVERIIDKKVGPDGVILYYVKWENYPQTANTWEPLDNLVGCERALETFEMHCAERTAQRLRKFSVSQTNNHKHQGKLIPNESVPENNLIALRDTEFQIDQILGVTHFGDSKYFLISLVRGPAPTFIRGSLANSICPSKVIDFYIRHIHWAEILE